METSNLTIEGVETLSALSNALSILVTVSIVLIIGGQILKFVTRALQVDDYEKDDEDDEDDEEGDEDDEEDIEDVLERVEEETFSELKEDKKRFRKKRNEI